MVAQRGPARNERSPIARRRTYLIREVGDFIERTGVEERKPRVSIEAVPRLRDRGRRVTYRVRVRGELLIEDWYEELRDIINRARSLLDNAMWAAAGGGDVGRYTKQEKDRIKFPLARHENEWLSFEASKHGASLGPNVLAQLRAIQPFVTSDAVIQMFNRVNNVDKHRDPLELALVPDALFAFVLAPGIAGIPGQNVHGFEWVPLGPIQNGTDVLDYRQSASLPTLAAVDLPAALCVQVDGEWIDVQDFLQDIVVFTVTASSILGDGNTTWADAHRAKFAAERAQLRTFRKMLLDNDPIAELYWQGAADPVLGARLDLR